MNEHRRPNPEYKRLLDDLFTEEDIPTAFGIIDQLMDTARELQPSPTFYDSKSGKPIEWSWVPLGQGWNGYLSFTNHYTGTHGADSNLGNCCPLSLWLTRLLGPGDTGLYETRFSVTRLECPSSNSRFQFARLLKTRNLSPEAIGTSASSPVREYEYSKTIYQSELEAAKRYGGVPEMGDNPNMFGMG